MRTVESRRMAHWGKTPQRGVSTAGARGNGKGAREMLTLFGSVAVFVMFVAYTQEPRSRWFVLLFAAGTAATALYSGLVEAYPVTVVEAIWTLAALRRFANRGRAESVPA